MPYMIIEKFYPGKVKMLTNDLLTRVGSYLMGLGINSDEAKEKVFSLTL